MNYLQLQGQTLGRYVLTDLLSSEAGIVATYKAFQPSLGRHIAVQILNPELSQDEAFREGFSRAAQIIGQLEHTNIVPVHDFDEQDDLSFIVLRLMTGGSLRKRISAGPLQLNEVVTIVKQIGNALDYVHSQGMAHGDPSIANILFDNWGSAYIGDFHVAGLQIKTTAMIGTPDYTAPERWATGKAAPGSDQYALGCITYHMLAGQPPFSKKLFDQANKIMELVLQHESQFPPSIQTHRPELPPAVNDVILRAIAKAPEDRYPTIMDFAREFEKAAVTVSQYVFISYSHQDRTYVQELAQHLESNSFRVWNDSRIDYGDHWFKEIEDAIKSCSAFLLVMTPNSYDSEWVQKEILLAKRHRKPIFPLLLDGEEFAIVIDLQFAQVQGGLMPDTDFYRNLGRAVYGNVN